MQFQAQFLILVQQHNRMENQTFKCSLSHASQMHKRHALVQQPLHYTKRVLNALLQNRQKFKQIFFSCSSLSLFWLRGTKKEKINIKNQTQNKEGRKKGHFHSCFSLSNFKHSFQDVDNLKQVSCGIILLLYLWKFLALLYYNISILHSIPIFLTN